MFEAPIETSLAREGSFVRPIASRALLYGIEPGGGRRLLGLVSIVDGEATTTRTLILDDIQRTLIGTLSFESFELVPGARLGAVPGTFAVPASLDVLPVLRPGRGGRPPGSR